jgi:hypothetical protein
MTSGRGGGPLVLLVVTTLIAAASPWIELPEMPFAERCVLLCVVSIGAALAVVLHAVDGSRKNLDRGRLHGFGLPVAAARTQKKLPVVMHA